MKLRDEFKFLNVNSVKRKNVEELKPEEQYFYIVNLLDKENNPVKFFSFDNNLNNDLTKGIQTGKIKGLQDVLVDFELIFNNNNWNVKLDNLTFKY